MPEPLSCARCDSLKRCGYVAAGEIGEFLVGGILCARCSDELGPDAVMWVRSEWLRRHAGPGPGAP